VLGITEIVAILLLGVKIVHPARVIGDTKLSMRLLATHLAGTILHRLKWARTMDAVVDVEYAIGDGGFRRQAEHCGRTLHPDTDAPRLHLSRVTFGH
jgi:hypothetical protein